MLYPKLFTTLKTYSLKGFFSDCIAGIIVGVVALPLAIAFGIASGVSPDKGLITAIVAGFIISVLGGSRVQIGGPTGAFVVIVYGIVQKYGLDGLTMATLLAGIILIIMGFAGFGIVIQYVPHPVVVGFTSGIAVVILSSQIKDFFGLPVPIMPAEFIQKWEVFFTHSQHLNPYALALSMATVLIIAFWPRVSRKVPGTLIALIVTSAAVWLFNLPVETIGTRFGELPHSLPPPTFPQINFAQIGPLLQPAFTIALLGGIESLLSAVVADGMIGGKHRSNMELIAQGTANIASGLFGGMPATGAIARTVTNIKNGGRTPVAGIVHAITLLILVLFLGKWAKLIPLSCLAGILVVVAYNMSEWRSFVALFRGLKGGATVLVVTFLLTVLFDLTVAIEIGIMLSVFLFMHRMAQVTKVHVMDEEVDEEKDDYDDANSVNRLKIPKGIQVYEINGPFFFGVSHKFEEAIRIVEKQPRVRILRLRHVPIIDSTGIQALKEFYKKCKASGIRLIISDLKPQPARALKKAGLYEDIGEENFFPTIREALHAAEHKKDVLPSKL